MEVRMSKPVACSLAPGDLAERRGRWLRLCDRALSSTEATENGVRLRFRRLDAVEHELRDLAALERECCSFAAWSVSSQRGELVLEVSAQGDAVAAVRAMVC